MFLFLTGVIVGGLVGGYFWYQCRREGQHLEEQKQLLEQEQDIVLKFMHDMVESIAEGSTREELFHRVVHAAVVGTGALSAAIFELREDKLRGVAVEGLFPPHRPLPESTKLKLTTRAKFIEQVLKTEEFSIGEGVVGEVARTREPLMVEDATRDDRVIKHDDPALVVRSVMVAPIAFRDKTIGVLAVVNPGHGGAFTRTDFSLTRSLADQAALAIHNSDTMALQIERNKLDVDLSLASNIQGMLLPKRFPDLEGFEIDAYYRPAQRVGGDLYDVIPLGEGRTGIAIADVSGKGIPASLLMAMCQTNLRHCARRFEHPSEVLKEMNRTMSLEMRRDMFVTIIYAIVDSAAHEVTVARAGHELPLHFFRADGGLLKVEMLESEGMALGMVPPDLFDSVIQETRCPMAPGDLLVLYTDGVTEATNSDGMEFSTGRLIDVVKTLRDRSAHDLNRGILDNIARFAGAHAQGDDITLLTLKHRA